MVHEKNWAQIVDDEALTELCRSVIRENTKAVEQYKAGKTKVFKALVGALAAKSDRKADMVKCIKILRDILNESK